MHIHLQEIIRPDSDQGYTTVLGMIKQLLFLIRFGAKQASASVQLQQGNAYYLEAMMKEGGGGDHISVGVKLPSGVLQRPISKEVVYITPPGNTVFVSLTFTEQTKSCQLG